MVWSASLSWSSILDAVADASALLGLRALPVRIEPMVSRAQFREVAALRREAYRPYYPEFVQPDEPDAWDRSPAALVLLARATATGTICATLRLRHSLLGRDAAAFDSTGFPDWLFAQGSFTTVERFAVRRGPIVARRLARYALFAAVHATARALGVTFVNAYTTATLAPIYRAIGMTEPPHPLVLRDALTNHVSQAMLQARTVDIPRRSRVPATRYLLWRLGHARTAFPLARGNPAAPSVVVPCGSLVDAR